MPPNLSYIVVTYNKLKYLKELLATVVSSKQKDEEIIVIDGGSNDGTAAYLEEMFQRGNIEQYVSEKDSDKAMLSTRVC